MFIVKLVKVSCGAVLFGALGACSSSGGSSGGGGAGAELTNGCDAATATDMTTQSTVSLSWTLPHHECILINKGSTVKWVGDLQVHPLGGGITPTRDPTSPISLAAPATGQVSVTFATAGEYPYFCSVHTTQMQGVVYVQ